MVSELVKPILRHSPPYLPVPTRVSPPLPEHPGKRVFDFVVALLSVVFLFSWLGVLIGLLIRLTSSGPILFIQTRTGWGGQPFRCFKFRTMYHDAPGGSFRQTLRNDDRVTPLGRFLRRTNLDELPQILNVLLGEMSIVGPRPHPIPLDAQYWETLPTYPQRYRARPGLTGLAQIRGCRGAVQTTHTMQQRLRYDLFYIKRSSLHFDFYICLQTLLAMFRGNSDAF
ncbi:MAG: sugar transferase [Cytophagales bacterium]|nr:MAG: sugar transferase [Cytophagales bacterium]